MTKNINKTVLVIDDTILITTEMSIYLNKFGFDVTTANNVEDGMTCFNNGKYRFVILDLLIPTEEDGLNLLQNLKNTIKSGNMNTDIIIMSATSKNKNENKCKELGADFFVEKSSHWQNDLLNIINKRI